MTGLINALIMLDTAVIVILVLLQHDKSGFVNSITGGGDIALFAETKERGMEQTISRATGAAGVLFLLLVFLSHIV